MDSKNPSISLQCFVTLACLFGFIHIIHGQKNDTSKVEYVFIIPEVPPQVKSGEENWHKWIQSNNRFYNSPVFGDEIAVVYIQYIVDSNNFIRDVQTIKGLGEPYDGEAERLVRECPLEWRAGRQKNKPVHVQEIRPIYFTDKRPNPPNKEEEKRRRKKND